MLKFCSFLYIQKDEKTKYTENLNFKAFQT